jgi:ADP-ribosyl-[dinitrogen reductase] hydrolase
MDSVRAALWAAGDHSRDVDTVAAVALGAACCVPDAVDDIPAALCVGLEDGGYSQAFLDTLGAKLADLRSDIYPARRR